jgi:hypothetical protein
LRNRAASLVAFFALLTAALLPGAAVFVRPAHALCLGVDTTKLADATRASSVILVGTVTDVAAADTVAIDPELFLKGAAQSGDIRLTYPDPAPDPKLGCTLASFTRGDRVLVFLGELGGSLDWPGTADVFVLRQGTAQQAGTTGPGIPEQTLVDDVRALTNTYAVPAAKNEDGAGINWEATIVPTALTLGGLLLVGLFLMRIWHRIDPS